MACGAGQLEIVEFLHSKGANLNVLDKVGPGFIFAFHFWKRQEAVLELLVIQARRDLCFPTPRHVLPPPTLRKMYSPPSMDAKALK